MIVILKSRADGFTLVELLVVLTIMGLVAALLVPRLGQRSARLASEQRTIALGGRLEHSAATARQTGVTQTIAVAALGDGVSWRATTPAGTSGPRFFGDGSAYGGIIMVHGRAQWTVRWLDGGIMRRDGQ